MTRLRPSPSRFSRNQKAYLEEKLLTCTHDFVRNEPPSNKLEPSYNGPYAVLEKGPKFFLLEVDDGRIDNLSIDRIKAANLLLETEAEESEQIQTNISGNDLSHSTIFGENALIPDGDDNDICSSFSNLSLENDSDSFDNQPNLNLHYFRRLGRQIIRPLRFRKSL